MPLASENFLSDPAIAQARQLLLKTLAKHQDNLTAIRPPDPARKIEFDTLIQHFNSARGGNLFFPYLGSGIGHGPFVELADGSVKLDFIDGIGVHHFGHSNPKLIAAAFDAALRDTIMQGNLQQNIESTQIAATLVAVAQPPSAVSSNVSQPPPAVPPPRPLFPHHQRRHGQRKRPQTRLPQTPRNFPHHRLRTHLRRPHARPLLSHRQSRLPRQSPYRP